MANKQFWKRGQWWARSERRGRDWDDGEVEDRRSWQRGGDVVVTEDGEVSNVFPVATT